MKDDKSFRRARADERDTLNEMTLAGLRYWGHDQNHPEAYEGLAAILSSADGPESHPVFVLEESSKMIGFYELRDRGDHVELLRMFLQPDLIGLGYGRTLWTHAVQEAAAMSGRMLIMADPGAEGFYRAMGARLERYQEATPGFVLGVYWYDLTQGASATSA
ncbi:MAG: GNAT family N-acetyltransferase [Acidimicrobiia bacterium]|nr:GNAT family N-acetyltransferase [Acidimicrobiia bacterium]